jgi:serine/threonine-protein kinase RsbW
MPDPLRPSSGGDEERVIELHLPSRLGYEKVAMDTATAMAKRMGFAADRVDSLRTAVSEAVTNAIEHGNQHDSAMKVVVVFTGSDEGLTVDVADQGRKILDHAVTERQPDIHQVLHSDDKGGWGIWLIKELMDEVQFSVAPTGGNKLRMVIHLDR